MLCNIFKINKQVKPIDYTDEEWANLLWTKSVSNDPFICRLFNIVNDKDEFKKQLGEKLSNLNPGEQIKVMVGGKTKILKKEENGKVTII